jgi:hypothetical protein
MVYGTAVTQDLKALKSPAFDIARIGDPQAFVRNLDNTLNIVFRSGLASVEDTITQTGNSPTNKAYQTHFQRPHRLRDLNFISQNLTVLRIHVIEN